jgi:glucosamine 6-phosphate synthetase-like amidotransferase/phosphosugar isomerase protein
MFGLVMSEDRLSLQPRRRAIIQALKELPEKIRKVLEVDAQVLKVAQELYEKRSLLIMGRGYNYATCLEGALKVKELTYMHSEGIQAGELKHGPLALVDSTVPILMILMRDNVFTKCVNALQQVTAREGKPILIIEEGDTETAAWAQHSLEVRREQWTHCKASSPSSLFSFSPTTSPSSGDATWIVRGTWQNQLLSSDLQPSENSLSFSTRYILVSQRLKV